MPTEFINSPAFQMIKVASVLGLIICSTLLVALNFKFFSKVFKERTASLWWLFLIISIVPFLVMLGVFTVLFERSSGIHRVVVFNGSRPVESAEEIENAKITVVRPHDIIRTYFFTPE